MKLGTVRKIGLAVRNCKSLIQNGPSTLHCGASEALAEVRGTIPGRFIFAFRLIVLAILLSGSCQVSAIEILEYPAPTANQARIWYETTRSNYLSSPVNTTSAWKFAEACFEWAEFATNDASRASLAEEGISAAQRVVSRAEKDPAGHFFLAMNKGQLARTKTLGALPLVKEMEVAFLRSIKLDPKFKFSSAHRSLGMLYLEAPGWPASIGSKSKARRHLQKAVELAPDYPTNHLELMNAYARWEETSELRLAMARFRKVLPGAREKFNGELWQNSWRIWDAEWSKVLSKAGATHE